MSGCVPPASSLLFAPMPQGRHKSVTNLSIRANGQSVGLGSQMRIFETIDLARQRTSRMRVVRTAAAAGAMFQAYRIPPAAYRTRS